MEWFKVKLSNYELPPLPVVNGNFLINFAGDNSARDNFSI